MAVPKKRIVSLLALLGALILVAVVAQELLNAGAGTLGKPAPAFTLKDLDGRERSLAEFRGKTVLLNFSASWCAPCNMEAPHLERSWRKLRDRGVVILGVNTQEQGAPVEKARAFQQQHGLTYPILVDSDSTVVQRYGVTGLPTSVLIDPQGKVLRILNGYDADALNSVLNDAAQG